ncbi:retropepsin-like aspartic protease family protein [Thiocystis violacea]|uniref:retropepsin-like aspartic protease family protein n=1 Tax=Thiocystis violacea TaxID=13725 RepID=UPI001907D4BE|nr:TIGR02281 family clan AA aspartic protease [Thiocystis violacea]MBK1718723.1 TIGR02281 family clan AA aspartic protease [Thiocystis violacea]
MTEPPPNTSDLPSRIGRAMLFGAWIAGLALLVMFFDDWLERQHNPNPNPIATQAAGNVQELVLRRNRAGHYVATGAINGEPVRFLVDTGATNVALPLSLARRLGLRLGPGGTSLTANGEVRTWSTRLERVDLGGLVAHGVRASVLPNMPGEDVLLGMSYLKHLELIQRGDTLTLRQQRIGG